MKKIVDLIIHLPILAGAKTELIELIQKEIKSVEDYHKRIERIKQSGIEITEYVRGYIKKYIENDTELEKWIADRKQYKPVTAGESMRSQLFEDKVNEKES